VVSGTSSVEIARQTTDASTLAVFQRDWALYRKMVDNNFLFHREAYARLRDFLLGEFAKPFRFVDIACGDAGASVEALRGTQATAYRGTDFSVPALQLARQAVGRLSCPATLEHSDFLESVGGKPNSADIIWIGLSLHHLRTPDKRAFMRKVRGDLADGGAFLIYENASPDGEDREGWMRRWDLQRPLWTAYSDEEFEAITRHVHRADFPETDASWRALGMDSGFSSVRELYGAPSNLFRLYCFAGRVIARRRPRASRR
jgi:ubiquinone/menaquinone biosynthesis C-methylase UbiE